jgi:hypothetical protein
VFVFVAVVNRGRNRRRLWSLMESVGRTLVVAQETGEELVVPDQAIHPAPDLWVRMRHALDEAKGDQLLDAAADLAPIELHGVGNGRQPQPEVSRPVGVVGHESVDSLLFTAAFGMLVDGSRHEPNPLPGSAFHAVDPSLVGVGSRRPRLSH